MEDKKGAKDGSKLKGKRGRPSKLKASGTGTLVALKEATIKKLIETRDKSQGAVKESLDEKLNSLLLLCLEKIELHANAINLEAVQFVETNNGKKKVLASGLPKEELDVLIQIVNLLLPAVHGETAKQTSAETKSDIKKEIATRFEMPEIATQEDLDKEKQNNKELM